MTNIPLSQVIQLLEQFRYILLFPITVVEGPIVTVIAGYLSSLKFFQFAVAYIIVVLGDLAGDVVYYYFGKLGYFTVTGRLGRWFRLNTEKSKKLEEIFQKHGPKALFWGKFTFGIGGLIILAAGAARVRFWKFMGYSTLGTIPKSFVLMLVGYYFGHAYQRIDKYFDYTAVFFLVASVLIAFVYFVLQKYAKRNIDS